MIIDKYGFSDKEYFHEMHHVEDPLEAALTSILPTHEDTNMVNFSHMDEPSSIYGIPLQIWMDRSCDYSFEKYFQDDQAYVFFSSKISSLPPISMNFIL
jgi:hypothetical protein